MVTQRGILFGSLIALALLGACKDVPIDGDTGVIVRPVDTTRARDTCHDCVELRDRPPVRLMTYHYMRKGSVPGPSDQRDSIDVSFTLSSFNVRRNRDGGMSIGLSMMPEVPRLEGSDPNYWGVREFLVNIPEVVVDSQGWCESVLLESSPFEDSSKAGVAMHYYYYKRSIEIATGDRYQPGRTSKGAFRITRVDPSGRFIDARLEATFYMPNDVYQYLGQGKWDKVERVSLELDFRIGLK